MQGLFSLPSDILEDIVDQLTPLDIRNTILASRQTQQIISPRISDYLQYVNTTSIPYQQQYKKSIDSCVDKLNSQLINIPDYIATRMKLPLLLKNDDGYYYTKDNLQLWLSIYIRDRIYNTEIEIDELLNTVTNIPIGIYSYASIKDVLNGKINSIVLGLYNVYKLVYSKYNNELSREQVNFLCLEHEELRRIWNKYN